MEKFRAVIVVDKNGFLTFYTDHFKEGEVEFVSMINLEGGRNPFEIANVMPLSAFNREEIEAEMVDWDKE